MDKCKRCTGLLGIETDGIYCLNCGWREGRKTSTMFTVTSGAGWERHYDPTYHGDLQVSASFLKRCPCSNKVAHLMGNRVRCNYCHKITLENKKGKSAAHIPSPTFAERVKEVVAEYIVTEGVRRCS